jgi:hypothetical protein
VLGHRHLRQLERRVVHAQQLADANRLPAAHGDEDVAALATDPGFVETTERLVVRRLVRHDVHASVAHDGTMAPVHTRSSPFPGSPASPQ